MHGVGVPHRRHDFAPANAAFTALSLALVAPGGKIAIVGATGNVGQNAVKQLVAKGYKARILLRKEGSAEELTSLPGVEAIEGDVTDQAACNKLVAGCTAILALHGARRTRQLSDFWRNPENDANHAKQINHAKGADQPRRI